MKRVGDVFGQLIVGAIFGAIAGAILGIVISLARGEDVWSAILRLALPGAVVAAIGGAVATAIGGERSAAHGMFGALLGALFGALGGEGLGANEWLSTQLTFLEDPNLATFVQNYVVAVGGSGPFVGMIFGTLVFLIIDIFRGDEVVVTAILAAIGLGILGAIVAILGGADAGTGAAIGALLGAIIGAFKPSDTAPAEETGEPLGKAKGIAAPEDLLTGDE